MDDIATLPVGPAASEQVLHHGSLLRESCTCVLSSICVSGVKQSWDERSVGYQRLDAKGYNSLDAGGHTLIYSYLVLSLGIRAAHTLARLLVRHHATEMAVVITTTACLGKFVTIVAALLRSMQLYRSNLATVRRNNVRNVYLTYWLWNHLSR